MYTEAATMGRSIEAALPKAPNWGNRGSLPRGNPNILDQETPRYKLDLPTRVIGFSSAHLRKAKIIPESTSGHLRGQG